MQIKRATLSKNGKMCVCKVFSENLWQCTILVQIRESVLNTHTRSLHWIEVKEKYRDGQFIICCALIWINNNNCLCYIYFLVQSRRQWFHTSFPCCFLLSDSVHMKHTSLGLFKAVNAAVHVFWFKFKNACIQKIFVSR